MKIKLERAEDTKGYKEHHATIPRRSAKVYKNYTQNPPPNKTQDYIMIVNGSKDLSTPCLVGEFAKPFAE